MGRYEKKAKRTKISWLESSDERQLDSSLIQGSILADNALDRPIAISEEQVEDNIPDIHKSILATEEQSGDTVI